jgi:hypothetical protein
LILQKTSGKSDLSRIIFVTVFAIAMGYLESAVVVYLRELYYPEGFAFPLKILSMRIAVTEIFREFATMVMLLTIGIIAGRSRLERFGFFIFAFGIWDIFYYIFLKMILGWPESLFTWDILFLLPTTWVGPVLAPCINALSMVIFGGLIWYFRSKNKLLPVNIREWAMLVVGSLLVIISYIEDYVTYLHKEFSWGEIFLPSDSGKLMELAMGYVPREFSWWIFWIGEIIILAAIGLWIGRSIKNT